MPARKLLRPAEAAALLGWTVAQVEAEATAGRIPWESWDGQWWIPAAWVATNGAHIPQQREIAQVHEVYR